MKALTVCQPYAELIARGVKPIENRTWPTRFRGYLAIHAGKSREWLEDGDEEQYPGMVFGAVVCVVRLIACLHIDAEWPERIAHLKQHEHANGPWCWVFARHVLRVEPIPAVGKQGLWELPVSADARLTDSETGTAIGSATPVSEAPSDQIRVFICDRKHPHYGESGVMTGKIISLFGKPMAEVRLDDCKHGTDGCFVSKGQVSSEKRTRGQR